MATRGRRKIRKENSLLTALEFVAAAQRNNGAVEQQFCKMFGNIVSASNSIITCGHPIVEDIQACPHTMMLIAALEQAPGSVALTLEPDGALLRVKSDAFEASVPCQPLSSLPTMAADAPMSLADERLRVCLSIAGGLVAESADTVLESAVIMQNGTVKAANPFLTVECWHGTNTDTAIIPKSFVTALGKNRKAISRIGKNNESLTIWFDDNAWIKTQLYPAVDIPDFSYLNSPTNYVAVPENLFTVCKRLISFSGDGVIYFDNNQAFVMKDQTTVGATEICVGMPHRIGLNIKAVLQIQEYCDVIQFNVSGPVSLFLSKDKTTRGALYTYGY